MNLSKKTLEKLRIIINGDNTPDYRKGYELVNFFNEIGFHDVYEQGFPSRWIYIDDRLQKINGTPELDKCIRKAFAVVNYIGRIQELDALIADFNQYLAFDKWAVIQDNNTITFKWLDKVIIKSNALESESCIKNNDPLAAVILMGSILEGVLLGIVSTYPQLFNQAQCTLKDKNSGKARKFPDWTLSNFIDVAAEIGILKQDVKKISHVVRDFRNYIYPYQQIASQFSPDKQTALICFQVLKAAIYQIGEYNMNYRKVNTNG